MKKLMIILLSTSFALLTSVSFAKNDEKSGGVNIIHKPDYQAIPITINESALEAHAAHGDCIDDQNGNYEDGQSRSEQDSGPVMIINCSEHYGTDLPD